MLEQSTIWVAFGLTLFAGLSTGIGSCIAFFSKHTNKKLLSISLGISAGVMIYVSFMEILPLSTDYFLAQYSVKMAHLMSVLIFFAGMGIVMLIDRFVPTYENPHTVHAVEDMGHCDRKFGKLHRMGLLTAIAIALHNFPEGIATFAGALTNAKLGVAITLAVAIHNIPEGIAVSVPIYCATGSRKKAFFYSALSGLAEPLGAVAGFFLLSSIFNGSIMGFLFASVAGIMVYLAFNELLPTAREYGTDKWAMWGVMIGMAVMAVSIVMFF